MPAPKKKNCFAIRELLLSSQRWMSVRYGHSAAGQRGDTGCSPRQYSWQSRAPAMPKRKLHLLQSDLTAGCSAIETSTVPRATTRLRRAGHRRADSCSWWPAAIRISLSVDWEGSSWGARDRVSKRPELSDTAGLSALRRTWKCGASGSAINCAIGTPSASAIFQRTVIVGTLFPVSIWPSIARLTPDASARVSREWP